MKSTKLVFISSYISGILLLVFGVFLLFNIKASSSMQSFTNGINKQNSMGILDNYAGISSPANFLLLIKEASGFNTDVIIIANYNPATKQISLLTIPRDIKPESKGNYKINSRFGTVISKYKNSKELSASEVKHEAAKFAAQEISNLTNISIDYYIYMEIDTIKEIVDKLGGVEFDVPCKMIYNDPTQKLFINLEKGQQHLDGNKVEQLLRFRKTNATRNYSSAERAELAKYYNGSDLKRNDMQIRFLNALVEQKVNLLQLPKLIPIINYAFENIITNVSLSDTLSLARGFTSSSRPDLINYKLGGVDRRIAGCDYLVYINKFIDTKTETNFDSQELIDKYFTSSSTTFVPDANKKYDMDSLLNSSTAVTYGKTNTIKTPSKNTDKTAQPSTNKTTVPSTDKTTIPSTDKTTIPGNDKTTTPGNDKTTPSDTDKPTEPDNDKPTDTGGNNTTEPSTDNNSGTNTNNTDNGTNTKTDANSNPNANTNEDINTATP